MIKKIALLGVVVVLCLQCLAQEKGIKPLTVGDTVPDMVFNHVINYKDSTARLSDFKGKLVILDFWATWCLNCIKNFPKLYQLEMQHPDDLKILLINSKTTNDSHAKVSRFLKERELAYKLTSIIEDTILTALFPHASIPHYIWIKDQTVVAVSGDEDLTDANIGRVIRGLPIEISTVPIIPFDFRYPLFENGNGGTSPGVIYQSFLAPRVPGLSSTISPEVDSNGLFTRITFTNSPLLDLYSFAYPSISEKIPARLILEVENEVPFTTNYTSQTWKNEHLYNYEAKFPSCSEQKMLEIVRRDLDKYFGYHVQSADKRMNCWILRVINPEKAINTDKDTRAETNLFENSGLPIFFRNYRPASLLRELEKIYKQPFLDETGLADAITLRLPAQVSNIHAVQESFRQQGFSLAKETRTISVIILSDK